MVRLTQTRYTKPNATKQWLLSHNFYYNKMFSDGESSAYSLRFPVCKYKSYTTLEGELTIILGEDDVRINVYDYGTYDIYPAFYYQEYGNYDVILETIWGNINKKLQQLRINKVDRASGQKENRENGRKNKEVKRGRKNTNTRK